MYVPLRRKYKNYGYNVHETCIIQMDLHETQIL